MNSDQLGTSKEHYNNSGARTRDWSYLCRATKTPRKCGIAALRLFGIILWVRGHRFPFSSPQPYPFDDHRLTGPRRRDRVNVHKNIVNITAAVTCWMISSYDICKWLITILSHPHRVAIETRFHCTTNRPGRLDLIRKKKYFIKIKIFAINCCTALTREE